MKKRIISLLLILALIASISPLYKKESVAAGAYWLTGAGQANGGNASLIYDSEAGSFRLKGKWGKGATLQKSANKYFAGKSKTYNKIFKKASGIKTGTLNESLNYDSTPQIGDGDELVGITCHVKIKGKKIACIVFSAM